MKPKIDLHQWRVQRALDLINEINAARYEHIRSGQAQMHREWFAKWEAEQLARRSAYERKLETATP